MGEQLAWGLDAQGHGTHLCNVLEHCVVPFGLCRRVRAGLGRTGQGEVLAWEKQDGIFPVDSQDFPYFPIFSHFACPAALGITAQRGNFRFRYQRSHFVPSAFGVRGLVEPESCRKRANVRNNRRVMLRGETGFGKGVGVSGADRALQRKVLSVELESRWALSLVEHWIPLLWNR